MLQQRGTILLSSLIRSYNRHQTLISNPLLQTSITTSASPQTYLIPTMRHFTTPVYKKHGSTSNNKLSSSSSKKRYSSFASKAFVATATASTSFAAYYCATALLFSSAATVNGDNSVDGGGAFNVEKKIDENYGIEYVSFDSYPGVHLDDNTGVATKEVKATSAEIVSKALDAAGLDESGIVKGITLNADGLSLPFGDDNTLHPKHVHRIGLGETCPVYGCPFLPLDVHYYPKVKDQLEKMRKKDDESASTTDEKEWILNSSGSKVAAVLTLIGYKGGKMERKTLFSLCCFFVYIMYKNMNILSLLPPCVYRSN